MTYLAKPKLHHPSLEQNKVCYTRRDYEGKISTLCAGCGHDSISAAIIQACWEMDVEPHRVAKLSGIGCSSKTPDYLLGQSHGFNSVHGRMPSVLTGANLANKDLIYMGVSGDGDSASIGLGQFVMRGREYIGAIKPCGSGLLLETLRFADEVREAAPFFSDVSDEPADEELLGLAEELIQRKAAPFEPDRFHDHYTEALRAVIEAKAKHRQPVQVEEEAPARGPKKGSRVRHPTLGSGVVLEIDGAGDDAKLTVYFDRAGKKRLVAKYAALELI